MSKYVHPYAPYASQDDMSDILTVDDGTEIVNKERKVEKKVDPATLSDEEVNCSIYFIERFKRSFLR